MDARLLRSGAELEALVGTLSEFLLTHMAPKATHDLPAGRRVRLKGLVANDFRHPLDRRQTRALERVPVLSNAVRRVVSMIELAIYQDNVSSSVLVSEKQYPQLHAMLREACEILDIPDGQRPQLFVRQNPVPNAYTLAVQGRKPFVVIHTALLAICSDAEVGAVIAHELGHLKCEHGTWLSAANALLLGASALPLPARVLRPVLERLQDELGTWQRAAELSCDRAMLLVAQEPWVPLSVMVKLSGGGGDAGRVPLPQEQLEAFVEQAKLYDEARTSMGSLEAMLGGLMGNQPRSHPIPVLRARELRRWADSEQFAQILDKGEPLPAASQTAA